MYDLLGKRAMVCGSTQGIGRACAQELARRGAGVTLVARRAQALREVMAELDGTQSQRHDCVVVDFVDPGAVAVQAAEALARHGTHHVLVNNTGGPKVGPVLEAEPAEFLAALTAHVLCNQMLVRALVPGMKEAGYGRIINIISTSVKQPIPGLGVSNTTRAAVANWAKTLAGELAAFGITVNNVLPGMTGTQRLDELIRVKADRAGVPEEDMRRQMIREIPAGRFGTPAEIAAAVGFLASPASGYVTGINLPVDGGRTSCL